jgi:release factor glutamine methyltransferase
MGLKIQTIKDIRFYLTTELEGIYSKEEIRSLSNIIIRSVLGITTMHQVYLTERSVNDMQASKIISICLELKTGKPIQYILGETIFFDCIIKLNSSTLIPRPETEELVDLIIHENSGYKGNIIDFGTGSGCIAIALAINLPESVVTGTDISDEALKIAFENATINNTTVAFLKEDILSPDSRIDTMAGIIVGNPPYVRNSEKKLMNKNVLEFEPHSALFVNDSDPLVFYNAILNKAGKILLPGGMIYFEINEAMGKQLAELLKSFNYNEIKIIKDINGKDRIVKGIKNAG